MGKFVEFGEILPQSYRPYGPFLSEMSAAEQSEAMLAPESSGEDSEVEISSKDAVSEIREMKLKLIDACDKMGPRMRHIL